MLRLRHKPGFWLGLFIVWFVTLWILSSITGQDTNLPDIKFSDKIAHFGYFFGGGGILTAYFYRRNPKNPDWPHLLLRSVFILALIGILDEFHQTFTPGRSGNDVLDWLADVSGATCGALVFRLTHRTIK
ncbi:MAG: VanZ family protein [Luteolibacter sp.]